MEPGLSLQDVAVEAIERLRPVDETPRFLGARKAYLDALPIAAAVIAAGARGFKILEHNSRYLLVDTCKSRRRADRLIARLRADDRLRAVLNGHSSGERFEWRDGGLIDGRHFTVAVAPLSPSPEFGPRALLTLIDRTSEIQTENSLRRQMLSDPLTGLANRGGFVEALELRIANDGTDQVAVVLVDLARFSRVNECIGTIGGDELIITVARRLSGLLRGYDLLGRIGANEFAFAVQLVEGPGDALHVARRIHDALATPVRLSDFEIKVDCAIGFTLAHEGASDAEQLIRHAQLALKTSKTSGRIEVYQPAALDAARRRFIIETELRRAIERDELTLAFQPLMSLATGDIAGFEALARWHHPDRGEIAPSEFIAVAEDSGLIVPLGRWALDAALKALAAWDSAAEHSLPLYMGVNLSPIQFTRDDVPRAVAEGLAAHRLPGNRLTIELTESAFITDPERAGRTLEALKAHAVNIAMDDFGTGFSNLASLQRLPIDTLKIDRSFVTDMLEDRDKAAIVRAILSLAQALGMATIAEGVETGALAKTLGALGCTVGQGYHFSPALPADAAYAFACASIR